MNRLANSSHVLFIEGNLEYQPYTLITDCGSRGKVIANQSTPCITSSEYRTPLASIENSLDSIHGRYKSRELTLLQSKMVNSSQEWEKKLSQLALMVQSNFVRAISFLPKNASSTQVLYVEKYDPSIEPTWQWLVEPYPQGKIGKITSIGSFENIYRGDRHRLSDLRSIAPSLSSLPLMIQPNIAQILQEFVLDKQTEAIAITYQNPENHLNLPITQLWSKEDKYHL